MNYQSWILDFGFWNASGFKRRVNRPPVVHSWRALRENRNHKSLCGTANQIQNPRSAIQNCAAFSLIEVTLAIGIVSFALMAVVALLPVGLQVVKNSNEEAAAANVLTGINEALRSATSTDGITYRSRFAGKDISFNVAPSATTEVQWNNLTLEGRDETAASPKRLSAVLQITAPADSRTPGRGTASVAWSAQADPEWDSSTQTWTRAEGTHSIGIQFLP